MKDFVKGQISMFDTSVEVTEPKPAPKKKAEPKHTTVYYKFICTTAYNVYTVYAQHEAQAFAKCYRMYGQKPVSIRQEY